MNAETILLYVLRRSAVEIAISSTIDRVGRPTPSAPNGLWPGIADVRKSTFSGSLAMQLNPASHGMPYLHKIE